MRQLERSAEFGVMTNVQHVSIAAVTHTFPRIAARPDPSMWGDEEILTLGEAAALMWPDGPIVTSTLRTAARQGQLGIAVIAGKFFTNKRELTLMTRCSPMLPTAEPELTEMPATPRILSRVEAAARLSSADPGTPVPEFANEPRQREVRNTDAIHRDVNARD